MDWSSWFRRNLLKNTENSSSNVTKSNKTVHQNQKRTSSEEDDQLFGINEQLIDHIKSFTFETFKDFSLSGTDDDGGTCGDNLAIISGNIRKDLSEWQARHAMLVLSKVKEISQLRYKLCPGYLKEHQFWKIYFFLVKSHIAEYELQAIRLAKLKQMAEGNRKSTDSSAIEVEMAETKHSADLLPSSP